jgi:DNA end-binding protein Ku
VEVRPQELEMAASLIESLTGPWRPEEFRDEYRDAVLELIEKKVAGEEIAPTPVAERAEVVDLVAALKASAEAANRRRATG